MNPASPTNKKSELSHEAFERLLLTLDADRDRAGEKYELLRLKLTRFFNARACRSAEERTDEVFDRLARKIAEGEVIRNLPSYCLGIARLVWLEALRNPEARQASFDDLPVIPFVVEDGIDRKLRLDCFNRCLREFPELESALLVEYYISVSGELGSTSECRLRIAERLQIPLNALRIRVHRIKAKFNECFEQCLAQGPKRLKYN